MTTIIKQRILVTGANGFIGRNLCIYLEEKGYFIRGAMRNNISYISEVDEYIQVGDIDETTDWKKALAGVDTVIHLAGRVHVINDPADNSIEAFRKVNVLGTERLARMAVKSGVKRFIFMSSVKVNGEGKQGAYTEKDVPAPQDVYGISKMEAEQVLTSVAAETGLQVVVLRLPLVYGPGVKANFKSLIKLANFGLPLPFKGINNRRSFLYLGNLVDAINTCVTHPLAVGETFMVSDGQDVSTPDLIKMVAGAMKNRDQVKTRGRVYFSSFRFWKNRNVPCLFYLHLGILKILCRIVGKTEELEKLTGSLLVDSSKIRNLLGWKPPFTMEEGIRETVKGIY